MVGQWDRKFPTFVWTSPFTVLQEELHVNDTLWDIRLKATHLFNKFSDLHFPSQDFTFDRSLMRSTWTLAYAVQSFKCAEFSISIYKIYEADNGHQHSFRIYTGKNRIANTTIVWIMFKSLFHKGHTLFIDNWYNSPGICRIFVTRGINVWGLTVFCLKIQRMTIRSVMQTTSSVWNEKVIKTSTLSLPKTGEKAKYPHWIRGWEGLRDSIGVLEKRKYHPKSAHIA